MSIVLDSLTKRFRGLPVVERVSPQSNRCR